MKRNLPCALLCALAAACSAPTAEHTGKSSAAVSTGALVLNVMEMPKSIYFGNPLSVWSIVASDGVTVHDDVTLTMVVTGNVEQSKYQFFGYDPTWSCTQVVAKNISITCHADTVQAKDGLSFELLPRVAGVVSLDVKATEGGVEIGSFHSDTQVVTAAGADMGVYAYGSGQVQLGQTVKVPFTAFNNGPETATDASLTLSLVGPGKFVSPPSGKGAPPGCTFTDTTATCAIGSLAAYGTWPVNTFVQTTGVGPLSITGSVTATEADPMTYNNTATVSFDVFKPVVADLAVTMTASADSVVFKKPLTYTIVVTNNGPDAATAPSLYDSLPDDLEFVSVTTTQGGCKGGADGYLVCGLGTLASGASATVQLVVSPTEGGSITNSVAITNSAWSESDPDATNDSASTTTTVRGPDSPVTVKSSVQKFDVTFFEYASCTNEYVILSGTEHYGSHTVVNDKTGVARYEAHANTVGMVGTGYSSGITYTSHTASHKSATLTGGLTTSLDYEEETRLVADGAAPDLTLHTLRHVTFAADGTPKVEVVKRWYECK